MASTATPTLDAHRLRADFAVFEELLDGKPVAYLDSASSTQKPRQVLDRMRTFYEHEYANVHGGSTGSPSAPPRGSRARGGRSRPC